jgi:hypothetical protein
MGNVNEETIREYVQNQPISGYCLQDCHRYTYTITTLRIGTIIPNANAEARDLANGNAMTKFAANVMRTTIGKAIIAPIARKPIDAPSAVASTKK